jgi:hypothetical protein
MATAWNIHKESVMDPTVEKRLDYLTIAIVLIGVAAIIALAAIKGTSWLWDVLGGVADAVTRGG